MYIPEIFKTFAKKVSIGNARAKAKHMAIEGLIAIVASIIGVVCVAACLFGAGLFTYYTSLNLLQSVILVWATVAAVVYSMNKILPSFFQINMSNITAKFTSFNLNVIKSAIRAIPSIILSIARQAFSFGRSYADSSIRSTMGLNPTEAMIEPVDIDSVTVLEEEEEAPAPLELPQPDGIIAALGNIGNILHNGEIEDLNAVDAQLTFAKNVAIKNTTGFFGNIIDNIASVIQDKPELDAVATPTLEAMSTSDSSVSTMTPSPSMDSIHSILPEDVITAPNVESSDPALFASIQQDDQNASDLEDDAVAQIKQYVVQNINDDSEQLGDAANLAIARQKFSFGSSYADSSVRSAMGLNPTEAMIEPVDIDSVTVLEEEEAPAPLELPQPDGIIAALGNIGNILHNGEIEDLNAVDAQLTFAKNVAIKNTTGFFGNIIDNIASVIQDKPELDAVATPTLEAMSTSDSSVSTMTPSPSMDSLITEDVTSAQNEGTSYTALYNSVKQNAQNASDLGADAVTQIKEQVSRQGSEAGKQLGDAAHSAYSTVSSFMSW